jgi:protein tyrosine phosphatase (PTP) superfamily phosphohydrolase (DUF442 family)
MRRRLTPLLPLAALSALAAAGCAHHNPRRFEANRFPGAYFSAPAPCDNCAPGAPLPPGRLAPAPPGAQPPAPGPAIANVPPGPISPFHPQDNGPGLSPGAPPQVPPADPPRTNGARLYPPETTEAPAPPSPTSPPAGEGAPPGQKPPQGPEPPLAPVDIPQFSIVKGQVAAGHKPFSDGVTWLRQNGYRTALYLRAPGEDDAAVRRQFEAKGIRYLSLQVSPEALTPDLVMTFNRLVTDRANQPLFVFDRDGSLAGGLWYLHFRIVDGMADEQATKAAARLGLDPNADGGLQRDMWLAVQNYLKMKKTRYIRSLIG